MSVKVQEPAKDIHPMEKLLRMDRIPHIWCPTCGLGTTITAMAAGLEQLELDLDKVAVVSGIGCTGRVAGYVACDSFHTTHARAIPFATGLAVTRPDMTHIVFSGVGDLSAIGGNHLIHAARRGHDLTVICANNEIYGMTGGQSASTTPIGARTATAPDGNIYPPFDIVGLVMAAGATYAARWPVTRPRRLSQAIEKAIRCKGMGFVEAISPCPTQFGRRNSIPGIPELFEHANSLCIDRERAEKMTPDRLQGRFVIGEWRRG